ncbi:MAG: hypothetical protein ACREUC_08855 [Steroidobacteraceae bacterium]
MTSRALNIVTGQAGRGSKPGLRPYPLRYRVLLPATGVPARPGDGRRGIIQYKTT